MSILDTIDNAVRDYEMSADAMRWTPEPQRAANFADALAALRLTNWQRQALAAGVVEALRRQLSQSAELDKAARMSSALFDEPYRRLPLARNRMRTCEPLRPARVSSMRSAYRHKTRNRW